jgi:hypothetical protein
MMMRFYIVIKVNKAASQEKAKIRLILSNIKLGGPCCDGMHWV